MTALMFERDEADKEEELILLLTKRETERRKKGCGKAVCWQRLAQIPSLANKQD